MSKTKMPPGSQEYPRPDFQRTPLKWHSLDGHWDFAFDDHNRGLTECWQTSGIPSSTKTTINVPFVFQSPASGINKQEAHPVLWYQKPIADPRQRQDRDRGDKVILHFGAVDYLTYVWVDSHFIGQHRGGHVPFEMDVTSALDAAGSRLTVRVYDSPDDLTQPRGKQYWDAQPRDIFYTPSSGIWQSVWLEQVPATRIASSSHGTIIRSHMIDAGEVETRIALQGLRSEPNYHLEIEARLGGLVVGRTRKDWTIGEERLYVNVNVRLDEKQLNDLPQDVTAAAPLDDRCCWRKGVALWSPHSPLLYDLTITLLDHTEQPIDRIETYVGMRSIEWTRGDGTFRLNGEPIFQRLCLDQGYWRSTLLTPPTPATASLRADIDMAMAAGFNGCRKHQKVEDPRFLYLADRLGFLVWGETANAYAFNEDYTRRFDAEWLAAVRRDLNHPCIVAWTPVNESWGYPALATDARQRQHLRALVAATKTLDPTRPVNDNCGWEHVATDLTTYHDYADAPGLAARSAHVASIVEDGERPMFLPPLGLEDSGSAHREGAPVLNTEMGGVDIAPANGQGPGEKHGTANWGYTTASDPEDLLQRIERLTRAVVEGGATCGFVYTQLADVEQEVNGLYTYDRQPKLDIARVRRIMEDAERLYLEKVGH